jgi:hypothetical protein
MGFLFIIPYALFRPVSRHSPLAQGGHGGPPHHRIPAFNFPTLDE